MKDYTNIREISSEIPFEGYLWLSDSSEPVVYDHRQVDWSIVGDAVPFVVEGNLFDGRNSYSIRHTGSGYEIREFTEEDMNGLECSVRHFMSNRMDGRRLVFKQLWKAENDPLCCDMPSLRPWAMVFCGFNKTDKEDRL